jgi:clathrin heavy chain
MPMKSTGLKFGADLLRPKWMACGSRTLSVRNILLLLLILNSLHFFADSYIKAEDLANFAKVTEISNHGGKHDDLVHFLQMARKSLQELKIDTELAYAYAKTNRLHGMEDFLSMTNVADILEVREKCFEDKLYQAAKLLSINISNWVRLATTLIYLGENQAAVESARKAGNNQ